MTIDNMNENKMIDLRDYGYHDENLKHGDLIPARVIELHRERYKVICPFGERPATLTGSFYHETVSRESYPAVGDFVLIRYNEQGESGIVQVLPRQSKFSRTDFSGRGSYAKTVYEQVVATNFDYVFIMVSLNRDFSPNADGLTPLQLATQIGNMEMVTLIAQHGAKQTFQTTPSTHKSSPTPLSGIFKSLTDVDKIKTFGANAVGTIKTLSSDTVKLLHTLFKAFWTCTAGGLLSVFIGTAIGSDIGGAEGFAIFLITCTGIVIGQHNGLVALNSGRLVDDMGKASRHLRVLFGTGDEERSCQVDFVQPHEIKVAPVHDIKYTGMKNHVVQNVHVM